VLYLGYKTSYFKLFYFACLRRKPIRIMNTNTNASDSSSNDAAAIAAAAIAANKETLKKALKHNVYVTRKAYHDAKEAASLEAGYWYNSKPVKVAAKTAAAAVIVAGGYVAWKHVTGKELIVSVDTVPAE
jgi:hypothetical protein